MESRMKMFSYLSKMFSSAESTQDTSLSVIPKHVRVVSYNVYFGDEGMTERMTSIRHLIAEMSPLPDVVAFQEVTYFSEPVLKDLASILGYRYLSASTHKPKQSYFCSMMVAPSILVAKEIFHDFESTKMERHVIGFEGHNRTTGVPIVVMTSHLESMRHNTAPRLQQLTDILESVSLEITPTLALFMGDTNLEDEELEGYALQENIHDAWVDAGSSEETRYTWDMTKNDMFGFEETPHPRKRYDRIYYKAGNGWTPSSFSIFGTERTPCGLFPSDHWGIVCDFVMS